MSLKYYFLLFVGVIAAGCSGVEKVTSLPNEQKIVIDGRQSDWKSFNMIEGENIAFGFQNDSENLYLSIVTNDKSKIMKIIRGGADIYFEPSEADFKTGIRFPDHPDPEDIQMPLGDSKIPDMNNTEVQKKPGRDEEGMLVKMFSLIKNQKQLYVIDVNGNILKAYPINGDLFNAEISFDKGNLCYELKVPFRQLPSKKINSGDKIKVEFETGEIEDKMSGAHMAPPQGGPEGNSFPGEASGSGEEGMTRGQAGRHRGMKPGGNLREKMDTSPLKYTFEVELHK